MSELNSFDPAQWAGTNATLESAISENSVPEFGKTYEVAPRTGRAVQLQKDNRLHIENPSGYQVCDFWAFALPDIREYLSMAHTHTALQSIFPKAGDVLVTNARQPIIKFEKDTSPGIHDTVIAACDDARYRQLGVKDYHDNCTDNLRMALAAIGLQAPAVVAPFNLWMNIPVAKNGDTEWGTPVAKPGDYVVFEALRDCVAVMSACPQDLTPVNGVGVKPDKLEFKVLA